MNSEISIRELTSLTGVTSRALRHYDQIGLLKPSGRANSGERLYSKSDLLRLQQILLLKELGLGLGDIASNLEGAAPAKFLRGHLEKLKREQLRLGDMIATVEMTIEKLDKGEPLLPEELFEGFSNDPYAQEAHERWPDQYQESRQRLSKLSKSEQQAVFKEMEANTLGLAQLKKLGTVPDSMEAQEAIGRHYAWLSNFWIADQNAYIALGEMYVSDPRFTATYDKYEPGLAAFMSAAMTVWARANLA